MDYRVEKLPEFKVIGIRKAIKYENAYDQIPNIWKEFMGEYCTNNVKKVISDNNVGEFALCLSSQEENTFDYVICGKYQGGEVPQGFEVITVSEHQWAIFKATGIMPTAFQTVNSFVYKEWLPGNDKYEIAEDIDVEHYQKENLNSNECNAELWIPIKIKI